MKIQKKNILVSTLLIYRFFTIIGPDQDLDIIINRVVIEASGSIMVKIANYRTKVNVSILHAQYFINSF